MKNDRQKTILSIIAEETVETQEQLLSLLLERGIVATQATISRDIKQLHLVKAPAGQGKYRYAVSDHGSKIHVADKLQTIFRESIVNVDYAQNLVVIHTMSGLANGAAAALDGMEIDQLIGTLAGDDTVLIIMRDNESAAGWSCTAWPMWSPAAPSSAARRSTTRWISIPRRSGCSLCPSARAARATSSGATTLCRTSSAGWSRTEDPPCWRR